MALRWPTPGTRFALDKGQVTEELPDDTTVQLWVYCGVDEPWTWRVFPGEQQITRCADCRVHIVVRLTPRSPTEPTVVKVCRACAVRRSHEERTVEDRR